MTTGETCRARVLRTCEAKTIETSPQTDPTMVAVPCTQPGLVWDAPNGRTYVLCQYHADVFTRAS